MLDVSIKILYTHIRLLNMAQDPKDLIEVDGEVQEMLPAGLFRVKLPSGQLILGYLSGKMRINKIRLMVGDRVKVQMTPYDLTKGRIVYRY